MQCDIVVQMVEIQRVVVIQIDGDVDVTGVGMQIDNLQVPNACHVLPIVDQTRAIVDPYRTSWTMSKKSLVENSTVSRLQVKQTI